MVGMGARHGIAPATVRRERCVSELMSCNCRVRSWSEGPELARLRCIIDCVRRFESLLGYPVLSRGRDGFAHSVTAVTVERECFKSGRCNVLSGSVHARCSQTGLFVVQNCLFATIRVSARASVMVSWSGWVRVTASLPQS